MSRTRIPVGYDALQQKGWWGANRWLLARRFTQLSILFLFLMGPWLGWWIVKGNLNYSLTLNSLPLADPLLVIQVFLTGHIPERNALIGVTIVLVFYAVVGGRVFCSWVCPVNIVTDTAQAVRRKLNIRGGADLPRETRYWILGLIIVITLGTGSIVWELVNPISMLHRGLLFGMGAGWLSIAAVFLFDLFVMKRGWCSHLCPVGVLYGFLGKVSPLHISAADRDACNDCLDCFAVCPEQHVIKLPLKGASKGISPQILSSDCTNCGRCIDVCAKDVFSFHVGPRAQMKPKHSS